ncbi:hypothetical protein SAMN04488527_1761, partial [Aliiroseovarius crassostreae]
MIDPNFPPNQFLKDEFRSIVFDRVMDTQQGYDAAVSSIENMLIQQSDTYLQLSEAYAMAAEYEEVSADLSKKFNDLSEYMKDVSVKFDIMAPLAFGMLLDAELVAIPALQQRWLEIIGDKTPNELSFEEQDLLNSLGFEFDFGLYIGGEPSAIIGWENRISSLRETLSLHEYWAPRYQDYARAAEDVRVAVDQSRNLITPEERVSTVVDAIGRLCCKLLRAAPFLSFARQEGCSMSDFKGRHF